MPMDKHKVATQVSPRDIDMELRRRMERQLPQTHLLVDYYRIRRRIAYPLPISELTFPSSKPRGFENYPWGIWLSWSLEERIMALGWAGTWFQNERAREVVRRDIEGLARLPWDASFADLPALTLILAHLSRTLSVAHREWGWIGERREAVENALNKMVDVGVALWGEKIASLLEVSQVLSQPSPHNELHNFTIIRAVGLCLAARRVGHPKLTVLDQHLRALINTLFELRKKGHSEGVGYDGYILDFVVSYLQELSEPQRESFLDQAALSGFFEQSLWLAAPGKMSEVAEIGDVEPEEMTFHASAQAKLQRFRPHPRRAWYLKRYPLSLLRADALAALRMLKDDVTPEEPAAGVYQGCYTVVMRNGWEPDDAAVCMSSGSVHMSHLHADTGTLVIGTAGLWMVTDPGYQQYLRTSERTFTLGPTAHNIPVINGHPQQRRINLPATVERLSDDLYMAHQDLTACYPDDLDLEAAERRVWLAGKHLVVVADRVVGDAPYRLEYHWHGHSSLSWWVQDGWATLYDETTAKALWLTSPQATITNACVDKLPGSRGQLTLSVTVEPTSSYVWWIFSIGEEALSYNYSDDYNEAATLHIDSLTFGVP